MQKAAPWSLVYLVVYWHYLCGGPEEQLDELWHDSWGTRHMEGVSEQVEELEAVVWEKKHMGSSTEVKVQGRLKASEPFWKDDLQAQFWLMGMPRLYFALAGGASLPLYQMNR